MAKHNKMIFVHGMQRTGNHALISWIEGMHDGSYAFLNNREPWRDDKQILDKNELKNLKESKDLVIVSYEDFDISWYEDKAFLKKLSKRENKFGNTDDRIDVFILRDPYNLFASRIQAVRKGNKDGKAMIRKMNNKVGADKVEMWKKYARDFLGHTDRISLGIKNKSVFLVYNAWFSDIECRKLYAKELGLTFSDKGLNDVANYGKNPSSFDARKYNGHAQDMKVLERWKVMKDDEYFKEIVKDEELMKLSEEIFGFGENVVKVCLDG